MTPTMIRTVVLAVLALIGFAFPGWIPEDARATITEHAINVISSVLALWATFAGHRLLTQKKGAPAAADEAEG